MDLILLLRFFGFRKKDLKRGSHVVSVRDIMVSLWVLTYRLVVCVSGLSRKTRWVCDLFFTIAMAPIQEKTSWQLVTRTDLLRAQLNWNGGRAWLRDIGLLCIIHQKYLRIGIDSEKCAVFWCSGMSGKNGICSLASLNNKVKCSVYFFLRFFGFRKKDLKRG